MSAVALECSEARDLGMVNDNKRIKVKHLTERPRKGGNCDVRQSSSRHADCAEDLRKVGWFVAKMIWPSHQHEVDRAWRPNEMASRSGEQWACLRPKINRMTLRYDFTTKRIDDFERDLRARALNLSPSFQRGSVWTKADRRRLIRSLLDHTPIPSVFIHRQVVGAHNCYDVIDGKQRLETIFMFMGIGEFKSMVFAVPGLEKELYNGKSTVTWSDLSEEQKAAFRASQMQVTEVDGALHEILNLFVAINSTGKRLVGQEIRQARFFASPILHAAHALAKTQETFFRRNRVFTPNQIRRQKHVEFSTELIVTALLNGRTLNKKSELNKVIANKMVQPSTGDLKLAIKQMDRALKDAAGILPNLKATRWHRSAELYTFATLMYRLRSENYVLNDPRSTHVARALLTEFSQRVDALQESGINAPSTGRGDLVAKYLTTIRADTDSRKTRDAREQVLGQVLGKAFESKDSTRAFNSIQRRLIWNSSAKPMCAYRSPKTGRKCMAELTWNNFEIDHIVAHSQGGRTTLNNAQIMCSRHNKMKAAKPS